DLAASVAATACMRRAEPVACAAAAAAKRRIASTVVTRIKPNMGRNMPRGRTALNAVGRRGSARYIESAMDARAPLLPPPFEEWFAARGWAPRPHQLELVSRAEAGRSTLLIAPTGAGKTLAGFLPSLIDLAPLKAEGSRRPHRLHTLYVSPLKALTTDVADRKSTRLNSS